MPVIFFILVFILAMLFPLAFLLGSADFTKKDKKDNKDAKK